MLMKLLGFEKVSDAKTLGNWLRRIGNTRQSKQALVVINKCRLSAGLHQCKRVTLDVDATVIECNNKETRFNCKGSRGYTSMAGHLTEIEQAAEVDFRQGNAPPNKAKLEFIKKSERRCRREFRSSSASRCSHFTRLEWSIIVKPTHIRYVTAPRWPFS